MGTEIERKFLVPPGVPVPAGDAGPILQGYLVVDDDREVRLRRHGDRHTLTAKRGFGLVRGEWETELTAAQFEALWPATEGARLSKTRHEVPVGTHVALVDVYHGVLRGLRLVEVEFPDTGTAGRFRPPDWFGAEITDEPGYTNYRLTQLTGADVAALVERFAAGR